MFVNNETWFEKIKINSKISNLIQLLVSAVPKQLISLL